MIFNFYDNIQKLLQNYTEPNRFCSQYNIVILSDKKQLTIDNINQLINKKVIVCLKNHKLISNQLLIKLGLHNDIVIPSEFTFIKPSLSLKNISYYHSNKLNIHLVPYTKFYSLNLNLVLEVIKFIYIKNHQKINNIHINLQGNIQTITGLPSIIFENLSKVSKFLKIEPVKFKGLEKKIVVSKIGLSKNYENINNKLRFIHITKNAGTFIEDIVNDYNLLWGEI